MFLFSAKDISEQKKHELEIKANLKEKESLLQEVHHRVKNNMQVMTSLMNLQIRTLENDKVINLFKESKNRIKAISMVHEKLYQTKHLSNINFNDFIKTLGSSLLNEAMNTSSKIRLISNSDNVIVNIATAIPCALILNELLSNSIQHGFPGTESGEIKIEFCIEDNNTYILKYRDNGKGFEKDFDWRNADSLGLQLVLMLVDQLHGKIRQVKEGDVDFIIEFNL